MTNFFIEIKQPESLNIQFDSVLAPLSGGYEEGYQDGKRDGYSEGETAATSKAEAHNAAILSDCNAVLPTKGVSTADTLEQVPQRIGEIVQEQNLVRLSFATKFAGLGLFDTEEVVLNLDNAQSLDRMIYTEWGYTQHLNTKVKHLIVNCGKQPLNTRQAFYSTSPEKVLERITLNADLSKSTNITGLFTNLEVLKVIDGTPLDLSSATSITNMLNSCKSVEEIRFAPNTIKVNIGVQGSGKLSDATIQSIIDGLADLTGQTAQTVTFHPTVGAKLTDAQRATITAKNWTFVY